MPWVPSACDCRRAVAGWPTACGLCNQSLGLGEPPQLTWLPLLRSAVREGTGVWLPSVRTPPDSPLRNSLAEQVAAMRLFRHVCALLLPRNGLELPRRMTGVAAESDMLLSDFIVRSRF